LTEPLSPAAQSYLEVSSSYLQGLVRIWSAEAAYARLACALMEFYASGRPGLEGPAASVLQHFNKIQYSSYDSLAYVTNVSHLVYGTTLLDTFLSDTTLFLFLLIPQSMGKNQQVPLRKLIEASSRNEALTQAALARTREIGYLPFTARIQFLRDTFGLKIAINQDAFEALDHYSSIRNTAVHDQGIFELRLDNDGQVLSRQKTCPLHPTQVSGDDVFKAIKAFDSIARAVAYSVLTQVLKQQDHPIVKRFLRRFDASPDTAGSVVRSEEDV